MSSPAPTSPTDHPAAFWDSLRSRFPLLQRKVYLNSCSCGALATSVEAAVLEYLEDRKERGSDWQKWTERSEMLRRSIARLLVADADEIAVTSSASAALNSIASALRFDGSRNQVVITDLEFPTHGQIWHAQKLRGAEIVQIASSEGQVSSEQFERVVGDRTLLVATSGVCYRNGAKLPLAEIARIARGRGALFLVDDYQALGTMGKTAKDQGADIVVGGMVKYLLGTAGIGFAYLRKDLIEQLLPTATGWFAQADIGAMDATTYEPSPTASRFEAGTPAVVNAYAAAAGLEIIHEAGLAAIESRIRGLTDEIKQRANDAGYRLATPVQHGAMIAIRTHDQHRLVADLAADGIVTSCRDGNLRVAPHFYNNTSDIDELFRALHKHDALLR